MKKPTSNDVAKLAGVSQTAVSLILNRNEKITFSQETRDRVLKRPNSWVIHCLCEKNGGKTLPRRCWYLPPH